MARSETASLIVSLIDKVTVPARKAAASIRGIGAAAKLVDGTMAGRLSASLEANSRHLDVLRGRMVEATATAWALQRALAAPIQSAMAFESAMADVTKVVDFDGAAGLAAFKKDLLDLSARLPVAVTGLAEIAAAAGQAGIAGAELAKFTEGAAKIGVAFDISAGAAGDAMAKLRTGLGYSTDETFRLADAMNELSNRQASSASDVLDFTTRVGAQAKMFGFAAEQAAAFGSAMISAGAAPEVAATSFNNMGRALTKGAAATKAQRSAFKALGLDAVAVSKAMQKDASGTTLKVMDRIAKLPAHQRASIVSQLFGDEARALGPLLTNLDLLRQSLGIVADETQYAGSASREYEARSKTTANALQLFRNQIERLSISIGSALLPALSSITESLAPFVDRLAEMAAQYPRLTAAVVGTTAALVAFRVASIAAAFAAATLRGGALAAALVGVRGLGAAAAVATLALAPFRAALTGARSAMLGFALAARIGGIGTALSVLGSSVLAMVNPMNLAAVAVRTLGTALRVAFIGSGVGAIIAGIAAAGAFIYENWNGLGEMFSSFGKSFMDALGPARPAVEGFASAVSAIWDKVTGLLGPIDETGAKWRAWGETLGAIAGGGVASLIAGIDRVAGAIRSVVEWARAGAQALGSFFGMGNAASPAGPSSASGAASYAPSGGAAPAPVPAPAIDGARARGGPVRAGGTYLVGEEGPEIFSPRQSGEIISNDALGARSGNSNRSSPAGATQSPSRDASAPVTLAPVFHIAGSNADEIVEKVMARLERLSQEAARGVFGDYGLDPA
ncbi:phage tail tape measure protein [Ancylobacter sp. IITR112]|uniref:phage tail tape measure protein n=1 Tax=Ancylobacter sp. IITR112 TaxID=3138073 RepID=UPI00352A15D6